MTMLSRYSELFTEPGVVRNRIYAVLVTLSLKHFFFKFFIVIQLQLCAFSPHTSTPPQLTALHTPPPPSPLIWSMCP